MPHRTSRSGARTAWAEQLHELRVIHDRVPIMMCALDAQRRVLYANRAFARFTGVPARELARGRACGVFGCINAHDHPRGCGFGPRCPGCVLRRAIDDTARTGRAHPSVEYRGTWERGGQRRDLVLLGSVIRVPLPGRRWMLLFLQDVTERRQMEERITASEERFALAMRGSTDAWWDWDLVQDTFFYSPRWWEMLGYEADELPAGRATWALLTHPDDQEAVHRAYTDALANGRANYEVELRRRHKAGHWVPILLRGLITRDRHGKPVRITGTSTDISARKRYEGLIIDFSRRLLAVREEERRRVATALHHDLGSLSIGVGARLDAVEDAIRAAHPEQALAALRAGRELLVRSLGRVKRVAFELRPPDLDLLGLPESLRQLARRVAQDTGLRVRFFDATHGRAIDPEAAIVLFRATQELLTNVVRHAHARAARVRLWVQRDMICLAVVDDGLGFDAQRAWSQPGQSLGLLSLREMALSHGGTVSFVPAARASGRGTRATVALPATPGGA